MEPKKDSKEQVQEFEKCPHCGEKGNYVPPQRIEGRKMIVDFVCSNGHKFSKITELK